MPRRLTATKSTTHQALKHASYESIVMSWLMQDGWQVFMPALDHGHQTDLLISDGPNYYRIQVKTVKGVSEAQEVENRWKESNVDVVVYFARDSNWGYVAPAFSEDARSLNAAGHQRFGKDSKNEFIKAFHKL